MKRPHLPVLDSVLASALAEAQAPVQPAPAAAEGLRARILARARTEGRGDGTLTLRSAEGRWVPLGPRVEMKLLREDPDSRSFLLRLHPGAVLPPHEHPLDEECLVLEGEVQLGAVTARAGDYHLAPRGVPHGLVRSEKGALLFLRGANPAHYRESAGP